MKRRTTMDSLDRGLNPAAGRHVRELQPMPQDLQCSSCGRIPTTWDETDEWQCTACGATLDLRGPLPRVAGARP